MFTVYVTERETGSLANYIFSVLYFPFVFPTVEEIIYRFLKGVFAASFSTKLRTLGSDRTNPNSSESLHLKKVIFFYGIRCKRISQISPDFIFSQITIKYWQNTGEWVKTTLKHLMFKNRQNQYKCLRTDLMDSAENLHGKLTLTGFQNKGRR